jgi:hypothetical protein
MKEDFNAWLIITIVWFLTLIAGIYQKWWLYKKKSTSNAAIELSNMALAVSIICFLFFLRVTIAKN